MSAFYTYSGVSLAGEEIPMERFRGKYVLVVNTASQCGFTPQFAGLEALFQEFKEQNLVVLGFPCNQFGGQEPGSSDEIAEFCAINYGVSFPMFRKVDVNGATAHPIFKFLKRTLPGILGGRIKWNFTKFLVGPDGTPIKRFASADRPDKIGVFLARLLEPV